MRGMPQRMPYSAHAKLGMSGTLSKPCGPGMILRGMGWSKRQCSTLSTTWTMSGLPPGGASFWRWLDI